MKQNLMKTGWQSCGILITAIVWLGTYFIARVGLEQVDRLGDAKVMVALLPVLPFALFLWSFITAFVVWMS